ncbi:hypothetical protein CU254_12675 [Amycolatopsis sp. AA4]|uniref:hypothetical protein n=1 Tax=Actinomycetes TaxID=1760 RepID=UPI0001B5655D|nr:MULTISPECIES: hypothetical protein [Actinomycetes]ATY11225.1 hypothetical protein CU254_12675 [Amycolatopsis sp. AA4]
MGEHGEEAAAVARLSRVAAARVGPGWWVATLAGVSWFLVAGGTIPVARLELLGIPGLPYGLAGGVLFVAAMALFSVRTGTGRQDLRPFAAYPSLRSRFPVFAVTCGASLAAAFWLGRADGSPALVWAGLAVAAAGGVAVGAMVGWMAAGIRGDIVAAGSGRR